MRGEARSRLLAGSGRGVLVAVVDSGWSPEIEHPRVRPQLGAEGELDVPGGDALGHGTACILRVLQVAPDAEIVPIRVFQNRLETSVGVLCDAIRVAQNLGAGIINLSLATRRTDATEPLYRVCEEARREGVVLVAAADNGGGHAIPAFLEPVLSVEQGNQKNLLDFTYHPGAAIECTAAGRGVPIPRPSGAPLLKGGSSVAAATMSGILARLLERGPGDLDRVRRFLVALSSPPSNPELHAAHPTPMETRNS